LISKNVPSLNGISVLSGSYFRLFVLVLISGISVLHIFYKNLDIFFAKFSFESVVIFILLVDVTKSEDFMFELKASFVSIF